MKTKELREMSIEKIQQELLSLRQSAYGLRIQLKTQQHQKTSETRRIRRLIARTKTVIAQKSQVKN